jgi:hypothetical protein
MAKRIDKLKSGTQVTLKFHGSKSLGNDPYIEDAIFVGIYGVGDDRRARFMSANATIGNTGGWDAYRFNGHWAYGTSAERLSLVE